MIGQLGTGEPGRLVAVEPPAATADASPLNPANAADLLDQSRRHSELFAIIYACYFVEIYRYVAGRLGADVAEDLAAETFLIAFRRRGAFDPAVGSVRPWLYGIATNLISQHKRAETRRYRSMWRSGADPVPDDEQEDRITDRLAAASLRAPLARALDALPARDRDVLLLVAIAGLSYAEVAQALSISAGNRRLSAQPRPQQGQGGPGRPVPGPGNR